jgi:hypothetical protein
VQETQQRAVKEDRDFLLVWTKEGVVQEPRVPTPEDAEGELPMYAIEGAKVTIERLFALEKKAPGEWPFWRSGACEPVRITYETEHGTLDCGVRSAGGAGEAGGHGGQMRRTGAFGLPQGHKVNTWTTQRSEGAVR